MVEAVPKFYPRVQPGPDPKQTRKVNDAGLKARDSRTGKLSSLEAWEGYRVFRDDRSPTGWINLHRIPIDAIDTHGHPMRRQLRTGKLLYVDASPPSGGMGAIGFLTKTLPFTGDVFGGILNLTGNEDVNRVRTQTGVTATAAIVAAGGLGAADLATLTGGGGFSSLVGSPVAASGIVPVPIASPAQARQSSASSTTLGPALMLGAVVVLILLASSRRR